MANYLKDYLSQTTVHGLRYLVLSTNHCLERIAWFLTILLSFSLASYIVITNVEETSRNPISTSIRVVPVQNIPFPAVTVNAYYKDDPLRLIENVFDRFEYDCVMEDPECMERTGKLRHDFLPGLLGLIRNYYNRVYQLALAAPDPYQLVLNMCPMSGALIKPLMASLVEIAQARSRLAGHEREKLESDLLHQVASSFRTPLANFTSELREFVSKYHGPDFYAKKGIQFYRCRTELAALGTESVAFAAAMYHVMGYTEKKRLGVGALVAESIRRYHYVARELNQSLVTKEQLDFQGSLRGIFQKLINEGNVGSKEIPAKELFGFLGPSLDIHEVMPPNNNKKASSCDTVNNGMSQPCESDASSPCCSLEKTLSANREMVLRSMKYVIGQLSTEIMEKSEIDDVTTFAKMYDYQIDKNWTSKSYNPVVPMCRFGYSQDKDPTLCASFKKAYTSKGIGYTFNTEPFWKMHKPTIGNVAFFKQLSPINDEELGIRNVVDYGQDFTLDLYIKINDGSTSVTLHDPAAIPDVHNEAIPLVPGMFHEITVIPSAVVTKESALRMTPSRRQCAAKSESGDLNIHKLYSQSACLFECQLKKAIVKCNCSAWDYPVYSDTVNYCAVGPSTDCFESSMADPVAVDMCACPNDCSSFQYSIATKITKIIQQHENFCQYYHEGTWQSRLLQTLIRDGHEFFNFGVLNTIHEDRCLAAVNSKVALVRVMIGRGTANQIERSARVTFSEQLASLGGIIGLFSGMSMVSLAEMTFWITRYLANYLGSMPK